MSMRPRMPLGTEEEPRGCNCPKTLAFLRELGATMTAKMHAAGDADGGQWSESDWRLHFREEERLLWPLFVAALPHGRELVRRFAGEHQAFRGMWDREIQPTAAMLDEHGRTEDRAVSALMTVLGKSRAGRG